MKNFNQFILTLLAAGLFASCSLTEEPTSFVNRKSFYKNESQCNAALNSCYMPANAIYTANFMLVTEACTDIWYSSSTTVDACLDVTPAKPQYGKNVWTQGYKGVMYCNECVECISSADLADGVKMPLAAEARVMRAFYYYVLTCMFGDVPFYTTMVDTDQRLAEIRRLPRTPAHEIRQELYDDLERNALPWFTAENGRKCRASEAVDNRSGYALALMLMAKFAMWNEDWNGALVPLQALEELYGDFNEGNYPLAETQWRYKNPAESIFEIQHAWSLTGTQYNGNVAAIMMPTHNGDGVFDGVPLKGYGTSMPGWSSLRANNRYAIFRPATGNTQTVNGAYGDALFNPLPLTYDTYDATLNRYTVKIDREALERKRRAMGGQGALALDDWGSGYSNSNSLLELSPDYIKVDITIICDIDTDADKQQLVKDIVEYAHGRGMKIVAEGIETEAELRKVIELGVDLLQGYFLAKPAASPSEIAPQALSVIRWMNR